MQAADAAARTVLVVDDEPEIRATVAMMLEYLGYAVREAASGEEALRSHGEAAADGLLLDVTMPGLDGDATLARLREADMRTPVILCSGMLLAPDPHGVRALGPTGFLLKPYTLDELGAALRAVGL